nr:HD-GYP domain-containing protein [Lachnospiraceae bacterium]
SEDEEEIKPEPVAAPAPKQKEKEVINETISYSNRLKAAPEYQEFQIDYSKALVALENTFIDIIEHNGSNYNRSNLLKAMEPMYLSKTSLDLLTYIHNMQGNDDSVYAHSINVALVCRAIGKWLKFNRDDLDDLTLAGLLHDIGKLNVPTEVLEKTGKLTDEEFALIKKHPLDGRKMLKQCPDIDSRFLNAALQHHERSDGSGYPRGLCDDEIDDFAAIVAIADVYDAMTATRAYRSALSPFEVIAAFEKDGLSKYRTQYILTFLERMAFAYQNSLVMLSDGRRGRVVYLNRNKLSRPILELADKSMLDLSRESDINIISIL